jgi:hypothetical protein
MKCKFISSDNTERILYGMNESEYTELCDKVGYTGISSTDPTTISEPKGISEYPDGTIGAWVDNDGKLSIASLWSKQETKIAENGAITKEYYQMKSDNTDLPFTLTCYDGTGQITGRIVTDSVNLSEKIIIPLAEGIEFQAQLTAFASTHSLQLPSHDMSDTKISAVLINYDGSTPTNISYRLDDI